MRGSLRVSLLDTARRTSRRRTWTISASDSGASPRWCRFSRQGCSRQPECSITTASVLQRRSPSARRSQPVARFIDISLDKRGVTCVARLLDDVAPRTCDVVWRALPLGSDAYHAKYARNEIYTLVPAFADPEPGRENPTVTPIPGDVVYFSFEPWQLMTGSHGYGEGDELEGLERIVDLALFYERNNLLLKIGRASCR